MRKFVQKAVKSYKDFVIDEVNNELKIREEETRDIIIQEYDLQLTSVVTDRRSRTNPGLSKYRDAFIEALNEIEMVKETEGGWSFVVPTVGTFPFNTGTLKVIQNILEGTVGIYVEIDADQYEQMYNKRPIGLQAFDDTARKRDMIYIMRYTADVRRRERASLEEELVKYPFSNTPSIDIFDSAVEYVEDNLDDWIDDAITTAIKKFKQGYRG
jgi:hypothetical protein